MGINSGLNPSLVKTELDEVFYEKFDYPNIPGFVTADDPILFRQKTADSSAINTEETEEVGAFEATVEEEEAPEATARSGNQRAFSIANYKKTLPIPKEYYDDAKFDDIDRKVQSAAIRARTTRDKNAFLVYGQGYATYTTNDGQYIFSNSHTNLNGDTVDNLETGALSVANLETMFTALTIQKAQDGELGGHEPVALLVPPALLPDANEICKSELQANTTDNNKNYFSMIYPNVRVVSNAHLASAYNTYTNANTAYMLISNNHSLTRWVREGIYTRITSWEYDDKDRWKYKMGYREKVGCISWAGLFGSTGAA